MFFVLVCGFLLYDLIDPALKKSIDQLEDDQDYSHNHDLEMVEPLSPNEDKKISGSFTKVQPEVGIQPISASETEKY